MASGASTSETSPLLPTKAPPKPQRTVTFNPNISTSSPSNPSPLRPSSQFQSATNNPRSNGSQPMLSALNSKLRRRNSSGAPLVPPPLSQPKIGPQRTTRNVQKLKLLPNPEQDEGDVLDEESGRDVYAQFTRIKDPTARRDAARLGKDDRERLPRVTAYCTAGSLNLDELMRYLKGKTKTRGAQPKLFDECIYTPYNYTKPAQETSDRQQEQFDVDAPPRLVERRHSDSAVEVDGNTEQRREDLIDLHNRAGDVSLDQGIEGAIHVTDEGAVEVPAVRRPSHSSSSLRHESDFLDFDTSVHTPEVFLFNYGTVVIWGMTQAQEHRFLKEIAKFEVEKLAKEDVQTEDFNFYYTREYQARIYNDFISLREKKNYMTKLAISHALSQSVKTSLYEDLVDGTIETTKEIPSQIAVSGKVALTRREINMQIGELFILRINIHLQGSVLDSPELMWAEPQLEPVYQAVRSYLEMDQRVTLLTERLDVIADLLAVLKDQLTVTHSELLEWVVIVLIAAEILVAAVNIVVDLYAGVD
ncbi:YagE family protein [Saccharata proteae CBS 121410]|uniref:YagE family protein n=1 Tax=Saccharata proteae CBS 121410 TaxID=1314787 RepID=A0A9P4HP19_9PEZI|nr:YagE family protein [Saccharata proteae CBS 121410]